MNQIDAVIFDLGGVVVELGGEPDWNGWTALSNEQIWQTWLESPSVRAFESGELETEHFARQVVREFQLQVDATEFLAAFQSWPLGLYRGARELLDELRERVAVACLSNTNALHWPRFRDEFGVAEIFDHCFVSHELGMVKPDLEIFSRVAERLGFDPSRLLFLDDNQLNVDGARRAGLRAERTLGLEEARLALIAEGLLDSV